MSISSAAATSFRFVFTPEWTCDACRTTEVGSSMTIIRDKARHNPGNLADVAYIFRRELENGEHDNLMPSGWESPATGFHHCPACRDAIAKARAKINSLKP